MRFIVADTSDRFDSAKTWSVPMTYVRAWRTSSASWTAPRSVSLMRVSTSRSCLERDRRSRRTYGTVRAWADAISMLSELFVICDLFVMPSAQLFAAYPFVRGTKESLCAWAWVGLTGHAARARGGREAEGDLSDRPCHACHAISSVHLPPSQR